MTKGKSATSDTVSLVTRYLPVPSSGCFLHLDTQLLLPRYCNNGICRFNRLSATYSNIKGCSAPSSAPCVENVIYDGACGYTQTTFGLTGYYMPDGAYCDAALTKVCSSGSCVTSTATPRPTTRSVLLIKLPYIPHYDFRVSLAF